MFLGDKLLDDKLLDDKLPDDRFPDNRFPNVKFLDDKLLDDKFLDEKFLEAFQNTFQNPEKAFSKSRAPAELGMRLPTPQCQKTKLSGETKS